MVHYETIGPARLSTALALWRDVVGAEHVVASGSEVQAANQATFTPSGAIAAIVRPASTQEVQACVRIASECRVPIYVVSRGRNWCYGSRTPPLGVAVLVELRRMTAIIEFSEELAYVRVQPGVTFQQLYEFLDERRSDLQMEATAGPPDGSVVGNALERGRSHGPTGVASRPVGDFEVVLPDGRLIHTSSRRFTGGVNGACEPFPVGPDVTGMFFESNVGIVTELTLWLARKPKETRVLRMGIADDDAFRRLVSAIRGLMLDGLLAPGNVFMINDARRHHALRGPAAPPSRAATSTKLAPGHDLPLWPGRELAWLCTVTIYDSDREIIERRLHLTREALSPAAVAVHEGNLTGVGARPIAEYANNPLWSKKTETPPDLDRDRVGFIAVAPVSAALPEAVSSVYGTMRDVIADHGFEPFINLRFWDSRSVLFVGSIVYDRDTPGADARALQCYQTLQARLCSQGAIPYRLPTFAMQELPPPIDAWGGFWRDVKRALDPHDILSPGRYDFRYCWPGDDASSSRARQHPERLESSDSDQRG